MSRASGGNIILVSIHDGGGSGKRHLDALEGLHHAVFARERAHVPHDDVVVHGIRQEVVPVGA